MVDRAKNSGADYTLKLDVDTRMVERSQKRVETILRRTSKLEKSFNKSRLDYANKLLTIERKISSERLRGMKKMTSPAMKKEMMAAGQTAKRGRPKKEESISDKIQSTKGKLENTKDLKEIKKLQRDVKSLDKDVNNLFKKARDAKFDGVVPKIGPTDIPQSFLKSAPTPRRTKVEKKVVKPKVSSSTGPSSRIDSNQANFLLDDIQEIKNRVRSRGGILDQDVVENAKISLDEIQKKVTRTSNPRELRKLRRQLSEVNKGVNQTIRNTERLSKSLSLQQFAVGGLKTSLGNLARSYASIFAVIESAKFFINTVKRIEQADVALINASGSAEQAAKDFEFVRRTSNRLGLEMVSTAENFGKFAAAAKFGGIEGSKAREVFTNLSKAVAGAALDQQRADLVFLGFQQTLSKGVLSMQEVRQQIGESLPQAMEALQLATGKSGQELFKFIESGTAISGDIIPRWAEELAKLSEDSGALAKSTTTLNAGWNRFMNGITDFIRVLAQKGGRFSITSGINKILDLLGDVIDIFKGVVLVVSNIVGWMNSWGLSTDELGTKLGWIERIFGFIGASLSGALATFKLLIGLAEAFTRNLDEGDGILQAYSDTARELKDAFDLEAIRRGNLFAGRGIETGIAEARKQQKIQVTIQQQIQTENAEEAARLSAEEAEKAMNRVLERNIMGL